MQMETEISVLVKTDYETLQKELKENNFLLKEEYVVNDIYMIDENVNISNMSYLDILKKCILVRDIVGFEKVLLYKYKKYAENGVKSRNNSNSMTSEIIEKARYSNKDITRHELNLVKRHLDLLKRKNGNVTKILTKLK